jgi:hypothetical protein
MCTGCRVRAATERKACSSLTATWQEAVNGEIAITGATQNFQGDFTINLHSLAGAANAALFPARNMKSVLAHKTDPASSACVCVCDIGRDIASPSPARGFPFNSVASRIPPCPNMIGGLITSHARRCVPNAPFLRKQNVPCAVYDKGIQRCSA